MVTAQTASIQNSGRETSSLRHMGPTALILLIVIGLCGVGLLALYSIGRAKTGAGANEYVIKQSIWMAMSFIGMWVMTRIRFDRLRDFAWPIGIFTVILLGLLLIPGVTREVNGARRWIFLGPISIQISDIARLGFLFVMAHYLASQQRKPDAFFSGYLIPVMMIGLAFGLILLQPDYGTAALFATVGAVMLFLSGARIFHLTLTGLLGAVFFAFLIVDSPERMDRLMSFWDLESSRSDGGYQLWQGILGFASGGVNGVGIGNGRQALSFLPEAHTDFIFAVIGEEMGLLVTVTVVCGFGLFFFLVMSQLRKARNLFEFLLVAGALLFISCQALINFGVVTGLLPTKGMSLPFVSYGGSNLLSMGMLVGVIINCMAEWNQGSQPRAKEIAG